MFISSLLHKGRTREGTAVRSGNQSASDERSRRTVKSIDPGTLLDKVRYVVFDTELTGLKPKKDSIVSIGAVKMTGGRIEVGNFFYRVVEPRTAMTGTSVVIHGITPSEAAGSPGIDVLLPEFLDFCGDDVVVGHVVSIDLAFINREVDRLYGHRLENRAVDTLAIYQWLRKKEENQCSYHEGTPEEVNLFALAKKYDIPVSAAHNALNDAFLTAQLFQRLLSALPRWGIKTLGDLLRIGRP